MFHFKLITSNTDKLCEPSNNMYINSCNKKQEKECSNYCKYTDNNCKLVIPKNINIKRYTLLVTHDLMYNTNARNRILNSLVSNVLNENGTLLMDDEVIYSLKNIKDVMGYKNSNELLHDVTYYNILNKSYFYSDQEIDIDVIKSKHLILDKLLKPLPKKISTHFKLTTNYFIYVSISLMHSISIVLSNLMKVHHTIKSIEKNIKETKNSMKILKAVSKIYEINIIVFDDEFGSDTESKFEFKCINKVDKSTIYVIFYLDEDDDYHLLVNYNKTTGDIQYYFDSEQTIGATPKPFPDVIYQNWISKCK